MHVQRSITKAKRKQQNFVSPVTMANGYLDWLFHQNVFPLRKPNSILFGKGKEFTFEELFRSSFTQLAFEFYCKNS